MDALNFIFRSVPQETRNMPFYNITLFKY